MIRKYWTLLLIGLLVLSVSLGCSLTERLSSRLATAPTATPAPSMTPRPTFTATPDWTPTPTHTATPTITPIPTETPIPTDTPTPLPTDTPTRAPTQPPPPTDTPGPPTATPMPEYPFVVEEQNDPAITGSDYPAIIIYISITDQNNTPAGGYKVVGDSTTGLHVESAESCFSWCAGTTKGGYAKVANVKYEPGAFIDGTWTIRVVDGSGTQVSPAVPLNYSTDPNQWRWDFVWFRLK